MSKTILLTGATDGIGLETAKVLVAGGHRVLLHGRNQAKLASVQEALSESHGSADVTSYVADLSDMADVQAMADGVAARHPHLDVIINNAGIFKTPNPLTEDGMDVRFAVNSYAPYLLTKKLLPKMDATGRVVNLSSAAQAPVSIDALLGRTEVGDAFTAYAESKLAITMWSIAMAEAIGPTGPAIIAVNPGSLLSTKMVKEGFGTAGHDIRIGVNIICAAALSDRFANASGTYFDNDLGDFSDPHPDALDREKREQVVQAIEGKLTEMLHGS